MKKIIINAFGLDKPGIVSKVTKIINSYNGNIEISKMIQLESEFTLLLLVEIHEKYCNKLFKKLREIKDLEVNGKITTKKYNPNDSIFYKFSITLADNEGIIYTFTKLFNRYKINIISMETSIVNAPITGSPVFILEAVLMIPKKTNISAFKTKLKKTAEVNSIEFKLQK